MLAQMVKNLSAMWETWVQSLGWGDPLGKGMPTYSSILAWRVKWTEEPGGLQSIGLQRVRNNWSDWAHTSLMLTKAMVIHNISELRWGMWGSQRRLSHLPELSASKCRDEIWIQLCSLSILCCYTAQPLLWTTLGSVASLVAQLVKNLSAMWETWVRSLSWEDPLEKGKATHSSILA